MIDFKSLIEKIKIASTNQEVNQTNQFKLITGLSLLEQLRYPKPGKKDGGHFLRTGLKTTAHGQCMARCDDNTESMATLLIIDCDKQITQDGEEKIGAPDPLLVHEVLKNQNIGHVIYGSYSHYVGNIGNRYRILIMTRGPYNKEKLPSTAEAIILMINNYLPGELLAYATENGTFAQPWYYPRKPASSSIDTLYYEYLEGMPVEVVDPPVIPPPVKSKSIDQKWPTGQISPIEAFNEQYRLTELLGQYGYVRKLVTSEYEKWLSPDSTSGSPGVSVKDNKFYSHHDDDFNDGYWHDAFDLMRVREGLSLNDAIIRAAKITISPDGRSVDEYNKNPRNRTKSSTESKLLPNPHPDVLPLEKDMLPEDIRDYVFDVAARQQSLPDFVAVAAIVGLSGLLGRKALICPKQLDDWTVTPNQWGAIIGRPSAMKSPSMKEALKPLQQFDTTAASQFELEQKNYQEDCELLELEKQTAKNQAKKALKDNKRDQAREIMRVSDHATPPTRKRYIVNDATVEKLGELLKENSNGLILVRDELAGWLAKLNKEEYQSDRAFYLECFDGNGHYTYDRIGRGTIDIQNCTLSIIGGIQPSKIATLVRNAIRGTADDGLIQRFQLAIWPDDIGLWEWIDRMPDQVAQEKYFDVFERLQSLQLNIADGKPQIFRFTLEAQPLFITWMKEIQGMARGADLHPALESHLLKMPQTIAGLALLFEIIEGGLESVGVAATTRAIKWAPYLISHARRLYSFAEDHSLAGARQILKRKDKLENPFSARSIQRKGWSGLNTIDEVNDALGWLIDYGYLKTNVLSTTETNGRPKVIYQWNSQALEAS